MITEDYCGFETAKLLKEKGFDEPCLMCYTYDEKLGNYGQYNSYKNSEVFSLTAPTLQMAMKWLRDKKNIHIKVHCSGNRNYLVYAQSLVTAFQDICVESARCSFNTYEEACEVAIKYCLENLI